MKDFAGTIFAAAKNQRSATNVLAWLIEVEVPSDPRTRFRITSYTDPIARGVNPDTGYPIVWSPFPVAHGDFSENSKGDLRDMAINVGGATREMMEQLEAFDGLIGAPAVIRLVPAEPPYNPAAERRFDGIITHTKVKQGVIVLTVGAANVTKRKFPRNRYLADHCGVDRFGDARCGYVIISGATNTVGGGFDFCPQHLVACGERGDDEVARGLPRQHPLRFDNCPGTKQAASK